LIPTAPVLIAVTVSSLLNDVNDSSVAQFVNESWVLDLTTDSTGENCMC